jgi:Putative DNA-binding domain
MSHLAKIQADFQAYLIDASKGAAFKSQIIDDAKVGAKKRLGIYYDAYRFRIIEALATAYPKLHVMLGDELFDQTARSYIDQFPSIYRNMRWVGDHMQTHLQQALPQHPVAAEMAAFEWALGLAFDAEDAPILGLHDLAAVPPENWAALKFRFHPSLQLLNLKWNVVQIWNALDNNESQKEEPPPAIAKTDEPSLVWRTDMNSHFRSLDAAEYAALQLVISGASFGALCEKLQENASEGEATIQAAQYLSSWLNDGLMTKLI